MREEILVRMGLDGRPLISGMQSTSSKVNAWASRTATDMGKHFSSGIKGMFAGFTAVGLLRTIRSVSDEIVKLKDDAKALEKEFGKLNSAQIDTAISVSENFKEAEKTGKSWLINGVAAVQLWTEAVATSMMTGLSMDEVMKDMARDAVDRIKDLEALQGEKAWEKQKKALLDFKAHQESADLKHMTQVEQIAFWEGKITELHALAERETVEEKRYEFAKKIIDAEEKIQDIHQKQDEIQDKTNKARADLTDRVRDSILAENAAAGALATAMQDRSSNSLGDIASSTEGSWQMNTRRFRREWVGAPGQQAAKEVIRLEDEARRAAMFGNQAQADKLTNRALEMRKSIPGLSSSERDPFGQLREAAEKAQIETARILREGVQVIPKD